MSPNLETADHRAVHGGRSLHVRVRAADLPGGAKLQTFVRPKKSSSTQDRAFEYVQKDS